MVHIVADVFHIPVLLQEGDQIVLADMRQAEQVLAPEFRLKEKPLLDNHLFHAHERCIVRTYPVFIFRFPFRLPVLFRCRSVVVFHLRSEEYFTKLLALCYQLVDLPDSDAITLACLFQVSPDRPKQDQQEQDNDASRNRYDPVLLYFRLCLAQLEFLFHSNQK